MSKKRIQFGIKPKQKYKQRPSAYAVISNHNGQILAVKVNGKYYLPGGGVEDGETPLKTARREMEEETGYKPINLRLLGRANQFSPRRRLNKVSTIYHGRVKVGRRSQVTEGKLETIWMNPSDFINGKSSQLQQWAVRQTIAA